MVSKKLAVLTSNSCDLANARTTIPTNLVKVMPLSTELPMRARASCALWMRDGNGLTLNALATCAQNSTEIPIHMIRLTKETAFNEMPQTYIRPNMLTTIIATTIVIMNAMPKLKPSRIKVTTKIAPRRNQTIISEDESFHCSGKVSVSAAVKSSFCLHFSPILTFSLLGIIQLYSSNQCVRLDCRGVLKLIMSDINFMA